MQCSRLIWQHRHNVHFPKLKKCVRLNNTSILTYLTIPVTPQGSITSQVKFVHLSRLLASASASYQVLPCLLTSLSTVIFQVIRSGPVLLTPEDPNLELPSVRFHVREDGPKLATQIGPHSFFSRALRLLQFMFFLELSGGTGL